MTMTFGRGQTLPAGASSTLTLLRVTLTWRTWACIDVKGEDAYALGREIAKTDGVFLGQSAAAALYAATQVAKRPENEGKNIVVILADNGMKYLSTNMYPLDKRVQ